MALKHNDEFKREAVRIALTSPYCLFGENCHEETQG